MMPMDLVEWISQYRVGTEGKVWSQRHCAEAFVACCGQNIRASRSDNWYVWNGKQWEHDRGEKRVREWIHNFLNIYGYAAQVDGQRALVRAMYAASYTDGVMRILRTMNVLVADELDYDSDPWLLNCPAGVLNLRDGSLAEHRPEHRAYLLTKMTACSPCGKEEFAELWPRSRFKRFMEEVFTSPENSVEERDELIGWMSRALGYCLTADTKLHALFLWLGSARAGKNTLGETLMEIAGMGFNGYAAKTDQKFLSARRNEVHPTEKAVLMGKRLAIGSELSSQDFFDTAKIKELVGDEFISARFMGRDMFTFRRTFHLIMYGNASPRIARLDTAIAQRLKIVRFERNFEAEGLMDPLLKETLIAERPLILRWLANGASELFAAGNRLADCVLVKRWSRDYIAEQDMITTFFEENGSWDFSADHYTMLSGVHAAYAQYCRENGAHALGMATFKNAVHEWLERNHNRQNTALVQLRADAISTNTRWYLRGFRLPETNPYVERLKREGMTDCAEWRAIQAWRKGEDGRWRPLEFDF